MLSGSTSGTANFHFTTAHSIPAPWKSLVVRSDNPMNSRFDTSNISGVVISAGLVSMTVYCQSLSMLSYAKSALARTVIPADKTASVVNPLSKKLTLELRVVRESA
jgi:hypothetical protein